jgi:hypothetical protein
MHCLKSHALVLCQLMQPPCFLEWWWERWLSAIGSLQVLLEASQIPHSKIKERIFGQTILCKYVHMQYAEEF